jgi:hypothetical protein
LFGYRSGWQGVWEEKSCAVLEEMEMSRCQTSRNCTIRSSSMQPQLELPKYLIDVRNSSYLFQMHLIYGVKDMQCIITPIAED